MFGLTQDDPFSQSTRSPTFLSVLENECLRLQGSTSSTDPLHYENVMNHRKTRPLTKHYCLCRPAKVLQAKVSIALGPKINTDNQMSLSTSTTEDIISHVHLPFVHAPRPSVLRLNFTLPI